MVFQKSSLQSVSIHAPQHESIEAKNSQPTIIWKQNAKFKEKQFEHKINFILVCEFSTCLLQDWWIHRMAILSVLNLDRLVEADAS